MPCKLTILPAGDTMPIFPVLDPAVAATMKLCVVPFELAFPKDTDTKAIQTKYAGTTAIITGNGVTASIPDGHVWYLERVGLGLTEGSSDDPLGTLSLENNEVKHLMCVLLYDRDTRLTPLGQFANTTQEEREEELRTTDGLLKQLARIGEAMKVKGVPDIDDLKEGNKKK